jgi:uncharacterized membrane-anchored protein
MFNIGSVLFEFFFTICLCVVGGLSVFVASAAVFNHPKDNGERKRAVKSFSAFAASVSISVVNAMLWSDLVVRVKMWKSLTISSFLLLLISMVIVHFESGRGKRTLIIGTSLQFVIYLLGFLAYHFRYEL